MKHVTALLLLLALSTGIASCDTGGPELPQQTEQPATPTLPETPEEPDKPNDDTNPDTPMNNQLKMTIGSTSFSATMEDNPTTKAFRTQLPMTVDMYELNSNEKYSNLPSRLPTASANPGTIHAGDLMLYGSTTLVLFYETFSTSYSYTRLGHVDNVSGLKAALGSGNIQVTFEWKE